VSTTLRPQAMPMNVMRRAVAKTGFSTTPAPDAAIYWLGVAAVFSAWRLQEIIPHVGMLKLPVVTLIISIFTFFSVRSSEDLSRVIASAPLKCVLVLAALAIVGAPFGMVRTSSIIFLVYDGLPTFALCLFIAAAIRSAQDARLLMAFLAAGGVIFSVYAKQHAYLDSSGRPSGIIFYDANDLALIAATSIPVALGLAHTARSMLMRLAWLLGTAALLSTVLWTVSRGAFLALIAMGVYLLFSPVLPKARRGMVVGAAVLAIAVLGGQSYLNTMRTMLNPESDYNFSGKSDNGRGEVWKRGMSYVWKRPVLGAGVRNFTAADGHSELSESKAANGRGHKWSRAHNSYIEIAAEMGIPGFLAFVTAIIAALVAVHRRAKASRGASDHAATLSSYLTAALITYAVGGFFLSAEYFPLLYALIGISAALGATKLKPATAPSSVAGRPQRWRGAPAPTAAPLGSATSAAAAYPGATRASYRTRR